MIHKCFELENENVHAPYRDSRGFNRLVILKFLAELLSSGHCAHHPSEPYGMTQPTAYELFGSPHGSSVSAHVNILKSCVVYTKHKSYTWSGHVQSEKEYLQTLRSDRLTSCESCSVGMTRLHEYRTFSSGLSCPSKRFQKNMIVSSLYRQVCFYPLSCRTVKWNAQCFISDVWRREPVCSNGRTTAYPSIYPVAFTRPRSFQWRSAQFIKHGQERSTVRSRYHRKSRV